MRGYSLDKICSTQIKIPVLDTAAFLAGIQLNIPTFYITTPKVIEEVKDSISRDRLQLAISTGKIIILEPSDKNIEKTINYAKKIDSDIPKLLSIADITIIAIALELKDKGCKPIVLSDDFIIHMIVQNIGIESSGVKRLKPKDLEKIKERIYICSVCGYKEYRSLRNLVCPKCGSKLKVIEKRFNN